MFVHVYMFFCSALGVLLQIEPRRNVGELGVFVFFASFLLAFVVVVSLRLYGVVVFRFRVSTRFSRPWDLSKSNPPAGLAFLKIHRAPLSPSPCCVPCRVEQGKEVRDPSSRFYDCLCLC